jgi:hypothetical protein
MPESGGESGDSMPIKCSTFIECRELGQTYLWTRNLIDLPRFLLCKTHQQSRTIESTSMAQKQYSQLVRPFKLY